MSFHLYQLLSKERCSVGSHFPVNEPWDTHGYVLKSTQQGTDPASLYLNLIRGTGNMDIRKGEVTLPKTIRTLK